MSETTATDWQRFVDHCTTLPPGPVTNVADLQGCLANVWDDNCGDYSGMNGMKLFNRMENVRWNSPILSFVIERHGGTVMGSSRAELQHWEVNVEKKTAFVTKSGSRQVRPRQPNHPMNAEVAGVINAIRNGKEDGRIRWDGPGKVKLETLKIFPKGSAVKMTLAGRRKRFRLLVAEQLLKEGWEHLGHDKFQKKG